MSFRDAFKYWLKLGFISFGGPAGQIAIMHEELVEKRRWISERRFLHALNYCMLLPGPEAQQLATYIGWLRHGTWGGIVAGALFTLPSLVILVGLSWTYMAFGDVPAVASVLYGIKPAVTAIVVFAAYRIGKRALKNETLWAVAVAAFIAIFAFDVPFPAIVLGAATIGFLGSRRFPEKFRLIASHQAATEAHRPALIDDHTPTPEHARFRRGRLLRYAAIGVALWGVVLGGLYALHGGEGILPQMGWFFTKAALLTFGGAYAVLPYVYQGAVESFRWLTTAQIMDGLALGETTPGPLIMMVAFVGFVGAWGEQVFGPEALAMAGIIGAGVAAFFTFLPSFLFILIGGPLVEATHGDLKFTAPLTAITAAVVGVVLNLAVFFAVHVLWPEGFARPFESVAALIGAAAFVAMWRYQWGIIPVIGACGALGLAASYLG